MGVITRCNVAIRTGDYRHRFIALNELSDAEIGDSSLHVGVEKNVTGLEITVNNDRIAVMVKIADALSDAESDFVPGVPVGDKVEVVTLVLSMQQVVKTAVGHVLVEQHGTLAVAAPS